MKKEIAHTFNDPASMYAAAGPCPTYYGEDFTGARLDEIEARRWGWSEAVRMLEALPEWKAPPAPGARWVKVWNDYDGDELDPARMYDGAPCLARRVKNTGRRIRGIAQIVVNVAENANVSAASMFWKTYAAARLVDSMESAGQRCEIFAALAARGTYYGARPDSYISTKIKAAEEPLNVALCLGLFAPWTLRYWYFAIMDAEGCATPGRGHARTIKDRPETAGAIIIDTGDCLSKAAAAGFIEKHTTQPASARP